MLEDEHLLVESCKGSLAAFELIIQRWDKRMLSYFYRCTSSVEDAKDLRQELFLRVYQSRKRFRPNGSFSAWIYTIASNLVIDKVARKKTILTKHIEEAELNIQEPHGQSIPSARHEMQNGKLQEYLHAALQQLPTEQRLALVMRHMEELTFVQIAQILDTSESTVKTRVYRGLVALKKELKRNGILESDCLQIVQKQVCIMNKREEMEQLAAEYLYDEISDANREKLMDWWKGHPEDQLELEELQSVMNCLNTMKAETASSEPLQLYDVTGLPKQPFAWKTWITAAAACVAIVICVSQGLVIEVGSTRVAFGPQTPPVEEAETLSKEMIPVLLKSVQELQKSNSEMLQQQKRLEKGFSSIALEQAQFQTELALYNQKQFKQFAGEFVDVMDQKLRFLMPVSYIPANYAQRINDEDNTNSNQ